jgi:glutamate dehydrogenase/leucine dehydrogenase
MKTDRNLQLQLPEEIVRLDDRATGLSGVIVLHSTRLGPAAGDADYGIIRPTPTRPPTRCVWPKG